MRRLKHASERVPRTRRDAIHFKNADGAVECGTALDAAQYQRGAAQTDLTQVTCAACIKELQKNQWRRYLTERGVEEPEHGPREGGDVQTQCCQCDRTALRWWGMFAFCPRCLPMEKISRPDAHRCPVCHEDQPPQVMWRGNACGKCRGEQHEGA